MSNPGQAGLCPHNPLLVKVMPHTSCTCCSRSDACRDNTGKRIWISKFSACQGCIIFLQASRSFAASIFPRRYRRLVRIMRHFSPAEVSSSCLLIQLSRCSYSSANHPGSLLPSWKFTLRDCCDIMVTIGIYTFCCRRLNGSNLSFQFVWRMDKIYFLNSYCRIGGAKNERTN